MLIFFPIGLTISEQNNEVTGQSTYDFFNIDNEKKNLERANDLKQISTTIKHIFSPIQNAGYQTSKLIHSALDYKPDITFHDILNNRSLGTLEGLNHRNLRKTMPPKEYKLWNRDYYYDGHGIESFSELNERMNQFRNNSLIPFLNYQKIPFLDSVVIISYPDMMKCFLGYYWGYFETKIPNILLDRDIIYTVYQ